MQNDVICVYDRTRILWTSKITKRKMLWNQLLKSMGGNRKYSLHALYYFSYPVQNDGSFFQTNSVKCCVFSELFGEFTPDINTDPASFKSVVERVRASENCLPLLSRIAYLLLHL